MAYFDSPKNRALWSKELAELRKKKEARANGSEAAAMEEKVEQIKAAEIERNSFREKTSYKELLAEELHSIGERKIGTSKVVHKQKSLEYSEPMLAKV